MALNPVAGQKFFIGGQLDDKAADFVASDFAAQVWVEVDGWETVGGAGDTAALISTDLVNRGRTIKQKGTKNAGQMQNVFAIVAGDAGQTNMIAASQTNKNYAFKIENNDPGVGGNPSKRYFVGLVMNAEEAGGTANTVQKLNATVEINSNIVKVAAS